MSPFSQVVVHVWKPVGPFSLLTGTENSRHRFLTPTDMRASRRFPREQCFPSQVGFGPRTVFIAQPRSCYLKGGHATFPSILCHFQDLRIGFILEAKILELSGKKRQFVIIAIYYFFMHTKSLYFQNKSRHKSLNSRSPKLWDKE